MKESIKDRVKGKAKELKGTIKEKTGRATRNREMEIEGKAEKAAGKMRKKMGDVENVFED